MDRMMSAKVNDKRAISNILRNRVIYGHWQFLMCQIYELMLRQAR